MKKRAAARPPVVVYDDANWTQIARDQIEILDDDVGPVLARTDDHRVVEGFGASVLIAEISAQTSRSMTTPTTRFAARRSTKTSPADSERAGTARHVPQRPTSSSATHPVVPSVTLRSWQLCSLITRPYRIAADFFI